MNVIKDNKAKLYNKSDIITTSNKAARALQLEVARRRAIAHNDTVIIKNLPKKAPTITKCIDELRKVGHEPDEIPYLCAMWNKFKGQLRCHYLQKSGSKEAILLQGIRKVESILDPSIRDAFTKFKHSKVQHVLDASNSAELPKHFFTLVTEIFNSDKVITSTNLSYEYGEPLHEAYTIPPTDKKLNENEVRDFLNMLRRVFIRLTANLKASGE